MSPQKVIAVLRKAGFENARMKNTRDDKTRAGRTGFIVTVRDGVIRVGHREAADQVWSRESHQSALNRYQTALELTGITVYGHEPNQLVIRRI